MHIRDVIVAPVITEKSHLSIEKGKYTFKVATRATKIDVRNAVEKIFNVDVEQINIQNKRSEIKNFGRYRGKSPAWKKAIVTVKKGQKIDQFFEGM
jgi:large subunit ribosomal protein L23